MDKELEQWYKLHKFHLYSSNYETKELADYLGVSPRTIQRWLKEKTGPNKQQIDKIRRYLIQRESKNPL